MSCAGCVEVENVYTCNRSTDSFCLGLVRRLLGLDCIPTLRLRCLVASWYSHYRPTHSGLYRTTVKGIAEMVTIASNPRQHEGTVVANGHCARHVQVVTGIGHTSTWRRGEKVRTSELEPGTVIATFDPNGTYGNHTDGRSHVAIYLEHRSDGILVMDQWVGHPCAERVIRYKNGQGTQVNDGDAYYVVLTNTNA